MSQQKIKKTGEYIMDSDGTLVHYPDPYKNIDTERADEVEQLVKQAKAGIEVGFLRLGAALDSFDREKLYLAKNYTSFKQWCDDPEIAIGYRVAHDLLRIVREVLPILAKNNKMEALPPVSTMRELLPVLADTGAEGKIVSLVDEIQGKTVRDAKEIIKEARGVSVPIDERQPTVFMARVQIGDAYHRVTITATDGGLDTYDVGVLMIKRKDWPRWEQRFGRFITYQD